MGIDINRLSPWAQKQIAQKIAANAAKTAQEQRLGHSKYNNTPDERIAQNATIRFSSKAEAKRYDELMLMLKVGEIRDLKLQPQFTLQEAYTTPDGKHIRAIRYVADFSYNTERGFVVEDVKSKATKTRVYELKRKLMREKYGIEIQEIE